jgi:glycosyltransferase involved in cell wall biosynthesis
MSNPRFSIVIPTKDRHRTLASAIQSVLQQEEQNFELIVQDNCSSPETAAVVRQVHSPKLKYNRSPIPLPMNENWEEGLNLCEGEYIYFMGDDDALMPDGLALASSLLDRLPLEILSWRKYTYWWDNAIEPTLAGRMFLHLDNSFQQFDPIQLLEAHYDWRVGTDLLPSIYNSLVHRDIVAKVKAKSTKYFAVGAPDNFTAIANAAVAQRIGWFERGLSMCGNSGASTGCSYFFRSRGESRRKAYHQEEGKSIAEIIHPALIPSVNLEVNFADMQLRVKEMMFPDDSRVRFNPHKMLLSMAANINRDPACFDDVASEIRQLGEKFGIDPATIPLPPRQSGDRPTVQGPMAGPNNQVNMLAINCARAGVHDSSRAAVLAASVLPVITIH